MSNLEIRELSPALLDDWLGFFDHDAFADFPWWSGCFCTFFNDPQHDGDSSPATIPVRRPKAVELVRSGRTQGLLAYADGKMIGWCNAAPRESYVAPRRIAQAIDDPTERVGSTVCFIVTPSYRGKGVASTLIDAACETFRRQGLTVAEGYPSTAPPSGPYADQTPWSAHNYCGPLSMYLKAGYAIHKQLARFAVVRKPL